MVNSVVGRWPVDIGFHGRALATVEDFAQKAELIVKNRFLRDPKTNWWNRIPFIWVILFQSSFQYDQGVVSQFMLKVIPFPCKSLRTCFFSLESQGISSIQKVSMRDCRPTLGTLRLPAFFSLFWRLRPGTWGKHHTVGISVKIQ
jgi:hypothetical protein